MANVRLVWYVNGTLPRSPYIGFWQTPFGGELDPEIPNLPLDVIASGDAAATGATLSSAVSIVAGAAAGDASTGGQTITGTETIVSGVATGTAASGGSTLAVAVSVIAGTASGDEEEAPQTGGNGGSIYRRGFVTVEHVQVPRIVNAVAPGRVLTMRAVLLHGSASEQGFDPAVMDEDLLFLAAA